MKVQVIGGTSAVKFQTVKLKKDVLQQVIRLAKAGDNKGVLALVKPFIGGATKKATAPVKEAVAETRKVATGNPVCPECGSDHVQSRGTVNTASASYKRYQCQSCKVWFRKEI